MRSDISTQAITKREFDVYFGTYTHESPSKGIHHAGFDAETGVLSTPKLVAELKKPSFLAVHPSGDFIYSVTEGDPGRVSALRVEPETKELTLLNQVCSGGRGPCHLVVSRNGRNLFVANYVSGSVASIRINDDGTLGELVSTIQHEGNGPDPRRQSGPHAHSVNLSPDNKFAYVADLGMDRLMIYQVDPSTGALLENDPPFFKTRAGAGPRHFSFHPNGRFAYLINELDSTVVALDFDNQTGGMTEIQTISTLPKDFKGKNHTAEVLPHPNGRFLYGSNRGHDSIVIYEINQDDGSLTPLGHQGDGIDEPRNFNIDPTGRWCLMGNQDANNAVVFAIDPETGSLAPTNVSRPIGKPICVKFLPERNRT